MRHCKSAILLLLFTASLSLTSCGNDEGGNSHKVNKFTETMYNHIIDNETGEVTFSSVSTHFTYDVTAVTIGFTAQVKLPGGSTITFEAPTTQMTYNSNLVCHTFNAGDVGAEDGTTIRNVRGRADLSIGVIYYAFEVDNRYKVVATSALPQFYATVQSVNNDDSSISTTFNNQHFTIEINSSQMTAHLVVNNFATHEEMAPVDEVSYSDIPVEITSSGYTLRAEELETDDKQDNYKLTDFVLNLTEQGLKMEGSYQCKGYTLSVSSSMFHSAK